MVNLRGPHSRQGQDPKAAASSTACPSSCGRLTVLLDQQESTSKPVLPGQPRASGHACPGPCGGHGNAGPERTPATLPLRSSPCL